MTRKRPPTKEELNRLYVKAEKLLGCGVMGDEWFQALAKIAEEDGFAFDPEAPCTCPDGGQVGHLPLCGFVKVEEGDPSPAGDQAEEEDDQAEEEEEPTGVYIEWSGVFKAGNVFEALTNAANYVAREKIMANWSTIVSAHGDETVNPGYFYVVLGWRTGRPPEGIE